VDLPPPTTRMMTWPPVGVKTRLQWGRASPTHSSGVSGSTSQQASGAVAVVSPRYSRRLRLIASAAEAILRIPS